MNKNLINFVSMVAVGLMMTSPAFAASGDEKASGVVLFLQLLSLVVVGGIIYNLWVTISGFGGLIGAALRYVGIGVFLLALNTLDEVIEGLTEVGSETLLGNGVVHDVVHDGLVLVGFVLLAVGLSKLSKVVKGNS